VLRSYHSIEPIILSVPEEAEVTIKDALTPTPTPTPTRTLTVTLTVTLTR